jgi:hypothetical protein
MDVSEEHMTSTFRVEEYTEKESRVKAGGKQSISTDYTASCPRRKYS